jgi:hypothetical protein
MEVAGISRVLRGRWSGRGNADAEDVVAFGGDVDVLVELDAVGEHGLVGSGGQGGLRQGSARSAAGGVDCYTDGVYKGLAQGDMLWGTAENSTKGMP